MMGAALGVYVEIGPGAIEKQRSFLDGEYENDRVIADLSATIAVAADRGYRGRAGEHAGADGKGQGELVPGAARAARELDRVERRDTEDAVA